MLCRLSKGPRDERSRIKAEEINDLSEFDIVVTTYEILVSEVNFFRRKYVWTTVIVDEGHRLKNDKSQLSEKLRIVPCLCKVILTGNALLLWIPGIVFPLTFFVTILLCIIQYSFYISVTLFLQN